MRASLINCISESSVHGIVRLSSNRKAYVKTIWLVALFLSFGYCIQRIYDACSRYSRGDVATTIKENHLDFEFPDVYVCNEKPISASQPAYLSDEDSRILNRYRSMVRTAVAEFAPEDSQSALNTYTVRLVNSLPFRFLSDKLGHQLSSVLYVYVAGKEEWNLSVVRSSYFINCFGLNITSKERSALQNPNNVVQLVLFLDSNPPPQLREGGDEDIHDFYGHNLNLRPFDWNVIYGTDFAVPIGCRIFLTPKGKHPSEMDTQVLVGPAHKHSIQIEMQDKVYTSEDFPDKCKTKTEESTAQFVDQYTGNMVTIEYSQAVCWYREVARLSLERFNCSVYPIMTPWEYRSLSSCFNLSRVQTDIIIDSVMILSIANLLDAATKNCERDVPCRNRVYSYRHSASSWPSVRNWQEFIIPALLTSYDMSNSGPGLSQLIFNSTMEEVKQSILQIELEASSRRSQEVQLSLAYSFNSLIADIGGLLGLFMGMSLLSILELLELAHSFAINAFDAIRLPLAKWSRKNTQPDLEIVENFNDERSGPESFIECTDA